VISIADKDIVTSTITNFVVEKKSDIKDISQKDCNILASNNIKTFGLEKARRLGLVFEDKQRLVSDVR
jgi:hypothetical protein